MKRIYLITVFVFVFTGCSKPGLKTTLADQHKSCAALEYEYKTLAAKEHTTAAAELSGTDYFHRGVVITGAAASLTPVNLSGVYFYLLPVMTVWYYNLFIDSDQEVEQAQREQERMKVLEILLEKKQCNEETN